MSKLTDQQRKEIYQRCIELGASAEVANKVKDYAADPLETLLRDRVFETEIEDIIYGAFFFVLTPEGSDYWSTVVEEIVDKGVK